jgi:hypothetical protein
MFKRVCAVFTLGSLIGLIVGCTADTGPAAGTQPDKGEVKTKGTGPSSQTGNADRTAAAIDGVTPKTAIPAAGVFQVTLHVPGMTERLGLT